MIRKRGRSAIDDEEMIARYAYALGYIPASVADRAFAAAFARLSPEQRRDILDQLCAQLPTLTDEVRSDAPEDFARMMRSLYARAELVRLRGAAELAAAFVTSPPVVTYFTTGVGSVSIDQQPLWVHQLARHETAPIHAGSVRPRRPNEARWLA